jgi:hypothetical protein
MRVDSRVATIFACLLFWILLSVFYVTEMCGDYLLGYFSNDLLRLIYTCFIILFIALIQLDWIIKYKHKRPKIIIPVTGDIQYLQYFACILFNIIIIVMSSHIIHKELIVMSLIIMYLSFIAFMNLKTGFTKDSYITRSSTYKINQIVTFQNEDGLIKFKVVLNKFIFKMCTI